MKHFWSFGLILITKWVNIFDLPLELQKKTGFVSEGPSTDTTLPCGTDRTLNLLKYSTITSGSKVTGMVFWPLVFDLRWRSAKRLQISHSHCAAPLDLGQITKANCRSHWRDIWSFWSWKLYCFTQTFDPKWSPGGTFPNKQWLHGTGSSPRCTQVWVLCGDCRQTRRPYLLVDVTWAKGTPGGKQGCWNVSF